MRTSETDQIVRLQFERGSDPPRGTLQADGQQLSPFDGWVELVAALERALARDTPSAQFEYGAAAV